MLPRQSGRPAGNTSKDASEKAGNKAPFTLSRLRGRVPEQSEGGWGLAGETFPYPSLESELARLGPPPANENGAEPRRHFQKNIYRSLLIAKKESDRFGGLPWAEGVHADCAA